MSTACPTPDSPSRRPQRRRPFAHRPIISRRSKRCSAPSWSTTRPATGCRASSSRSISSIALHGRIYDHAAKLIWAGKRATPITLKTFFQGDEPVGELTVPQYLGRLAANATTIINAEDYGRTIYDLAIRRDLIQIGEGMVNTAYDAPIDAPPAVQIEDTEQKLYELAETGKYGSGFEPFTTALTDAIDMAANAYRRDGGLSGLATGFTDLDQQDGRPAALRPDHRRRAPVHGQDGARHQHRLSRGAELPAATRDSETALDGAVVGFFSLEMSAEQLATRIISEQAYIPSERIRRGTHRVRGVRPHRRGLARSCRTSPLYIDQTGGITVAQLAARARRLKRQRDVGLHRRRLSPASVRLDAAAPPRAACRRSPRSPRGSKALAKELHVPVLALSQLSRQVEQREDKRPQLADLRESGSIEQDADVVLFVFREEYYVERRQPRENTEEHKQWQQEMELVTGKAEVIIGKQRHGPTGTVRLQFTPEFTRFGNLAAEERLPERRD